MKKSYLLLLALFLIHSMSFAGVQVKLAFILGTVQYKENIKDKEWKTAHLNMMLNESSSIRTGKGSLAMLLIQDDIKIKVSGMTTMEIKKLKDEKTLQIYTGKIWSKVNKQEEGKTFAVRSPASVIGVRGTEFIFETTQIEDKLYVSEGLVAFSKAQGQEKAAEVQAGEIASLKKEKEKENSIIVKEATFEDLKKLKTDFNLKLYSKNNSYSGSSLEPFWDWDSGK